MDKPACPSGDWHLEDNRSGHVTPPHSQLHPGVTLREYYAGLAMQGLLASWPFDQPWQHETVAMIAAAFADALIAELAKPR